MLGQRQVSGGSQIRVSAESHLLLPAPPRSPSSSHRRPSQLRHLEEASMPRAIQFFSQAVNLCPERWTSSSQILSQFHLEGHRFSYLTTLVGFVHALHKILILWQRRVVDSRIGSLHNRSLERLYPLSTFKSAVYYDFIDNLPQRQRFFYHGGGRVPSTQSLLPSLPPHPHHPLTVHGPSTESF